ncbi:hypothetical protein P8452_55011 [Trifolium repens]|nr:hypothetical protein P8452_55011 [Trifolium repens]
MLIWRFQLATLTQLRNIFGLGIREAEEITIDVTSKVYCKHLAKAFSGGKIRRFQIRILFAKVKFHLMHIVNIGLSPSKKMSQRQKGMHHIGGEEAAASEVSFGGEIDGEKCCVVLLMLLFGGRSVEPEDRGETIVLFEKKTCLF